MNDTCSRQTDLQAAAKQAMMDNGFEPEFSPQVQQELAELKVHSQQRAPSANIRDLRALTAGSTPA